MAVMKVILAVAVVCVILGESQASMKRRRAVKDNDEKKKEPDWKPVTGTREFSVNVDDQIRGANQFRTEKWNNGSVIGSYAIPTRDGKWLKTNYEADDKGYRITKTELLDADKLMNGADRAKDHTAHIGVIQDGKPVDYTVTEDELKKAQAKNKENQAKEQAKQQ